MPNSTLTINDVGVLFFGKEPGELVRQIVSDYWPHELLFIRDRATEELSDLVSDALKEVTLIDADVVGRLPISLNAGVDFGNLLELEMPGIDGISIKLRGAADFELDVSQFGVWAQARGPTLEITFSEPLVTEQVSWSWRPNITFVLNEHGPDFDFEIDEDRSANSSQPIVLHLSEIVRIRVAGLKPVLGESALQALGDRREKLGIPNDWRGVFIDEAFLLLGDGEEPLEIGFDDALIGLGGFSGNLEMIRANDAPITETSIGGVSIQLDRVSAQIRENQFLEGSIEGQITVSEELVSVIVYFSSDGSIELAANLPGPYRPIELGERGNPNSHFVLLEVSDVACVVSEGVTLSGTAALEIFVPEMIDAKATIPKLSLDQDGRLQTGTIWTAIDSPALSRLKNMVDIEIREFGFGQLDDARFIGFSAKATLADGLGEGQVNKLELRYSPDGIEVGLKGIAIELNAPNVMKASGELVVDDGQLSGEFDILLTPVNLSLYGSFEKYDSGWSLSIGMTIPCGIDLAGSGLSIYELMGGYASGIEPRLDEALPPAEKWKNWAFETSPMPFTQLKPNASGGWLSTPGSDLFIAGVGLGTSGDSGYSFWLDAVFAVNLPGPIILVTGYADVASDRMTIPALADKLPPIRALLVIDLTHSEILIALDVNKKFPDPSAEVYDISAAAEAYFDPQKWHVKIGEISPKEKRIRIKLMAGLVYSSGYVMADPDGLAFGAETGYDIDQTYGPLRVIVRAGFGFDLDIAVNPEHLRAQVGLWANVQLEVFGASFGFSASLTAFLELPEPESVYVEYTFTVSFLFFTENFEGRLNLIDPVEGNLSPPRPLHSFSGLEHANRNGILLKEQLADGERNELSSDAAIVIEFSHATALSRGRLSSFQTESYEQPAQLIVGNENVAKAQYAVSIGDNSFIPQLSQITVRRVSGPGMGVQNTKIFSYWEETVSKLGQQRIWIGGGIDSHDFTSPQTATVNSERPATSSPISSESFFVEGSVVLPRIHKIVRDGVILSVHSAFLGQLETETQDKHRTYFAFNKDQTLIISWSQPIIWLQIKLAKPLSGIEAKSRAFPGLSFKANVHGLIEVNLREGTTEVYLERVGWQKDDEDELIGIEEISWRAAKDPLALRSRLESEGPIWIPGSTYEISVSTENEITSGGSATFVDTRVFDVPLPTGDDLQCLVQELPGKTDTHFCGYDFEVRFNRTYVFALWRSLGYRLRIHLYDEFGQELNLPDRNREVFERQASSRTQSKRELENSNGVNLEGVIARNDDVLSKFLFSIAELNRALLGTLIKFEIQAEPEDQNLIGFQPHPGLETTLLRGELNISKFHTVRDMFNSAQDNLRTLQPQARKGPVDEDSYNALAARLNLPTAAAAVSTPSTIVFGDAKSARDRLTNLQRKIILFQFPHCLDPERFSATAINPVTSRRQPLSLYWEAAGSRVFLVIPKGWTKSQIRFSGKEVINADERIFRVYSAGLVVNETIDVTVDGAQDA